ncbi:hypothetical protein L1994_05395 [Methanomicrobium antiquum]|uniref:Uncharacterized protein n=1 Tax=Methanomicrobium antiquum TaxID=487686 RepID=A0AAF0G0A9_9EURY|nr:hypothetical protein [Methanomicrobium antiquum]WFN37819.1 hypothetical protein L1994_05395 [Methanomicrobium antiquum]
MKKYSVLSVLIISVIFVISTIPIASAGDDSKYSYIEVENITLELTKNTAEYNINYKIDDGIQILVVFLGKSDLKNKLCKIMNSDNCRFENVEMDNAIIIFDNPSIDNGDGSLWFPRKDLEVTVPEITVKTPRSTRNFIDASEIPGMGYFADALPQQN